MAINCNEDVNSVSIPHDDRVEVNIHQNETPDSSTLNRASNRLLANDKQLLAYLKNVALTNISDGLSGCVKLSEPGCLTLDMNYISQNVCLSLAQLDGILKLADLCDTCIVSPQDGEALVWNTTQNCTSCI
jgi:hypothetical protein